MKRFTFSLLMLLISVTSAYSFNYDYGQTWVTKMFLSKPDAKGESDVRITFEQALQMIKKTDQMTLGVPKIVYLVGWQYKGHDGKYPAFFEVNPRLKRASDATALQSLQWLMNEARNYHTVVSLHINMTDAYIDSPLWDEYVSNDLISKDIDGTLKVIGEYNNRKAYQVNYKNEWQKGYAQMRIDRLIQLIPELKQAGTIHIDAWIARPSEGHNETIIEEANYQKKIANYWHAKGIDATSEWVMDYMVGIVPYAWHFNGFWQKDYLSTPASVYTGSGINPDIRSSDHALGFLFGTSCYGEPFWKFEDGYSWEKALMKDFMQKCPQYFFLNSLKRLKVEGTAIERTAYFSNQVKVSLKDSTITQSDRWLRKCNTYCLPAVWRDDQGVILYTDQSVNKTTFPTPLMWGNINEATLYQITTNGLTKVKQIKLSKASFTVNIAKETPYYLIPKR